MPVLMADVLIGKCKNLVVGWIGCTTVTFSLHMKKRIGHIYQKFVGTDVLCVENILLDSL